MRLEFKQALHVKGKDYKRGFHEILDAAVLGDKVLHKYVALGLIVEAAAEIKPVSQDEKQKALAGKLLSKLPAEEVTAVSEPVDASVADVSPEEKAKDIGKKKKR